MPPNEFLLWLSARKNGSWSQFRGAVERLELGSEMDAIEQDTLLPLHQRIRFNLERLGHVEFAAGECEDGWRIVPPTLALSQHKSGVVGVLCGARTEKLVERIERTASGLPLKLERVSQPDCPDVLRTLAQDETVLMKLTEQEGVFCQLDCPTAFALGYLFYRIEEISAT